MAVLTEGQAAAGRHLTPRVATLASHAGPSGHPEPAKAAKGTPKAAAREQQQAQQVACLSVRSLNLLAAAAPLAITIEL